MMGSTITGGMVAGLLLERAAYAKELSGVAVTAGFMPDVPDEAVQFRTYGNSIGTLPFDYGVCVWRVHVMARSGDFERSDYLAGALYCLFNSGLDEEERVMMLGNDTPAICRPVQRPYLLKVDAKDRIYQGFNLIVHLCNGG